MKTASDLLMEGILRVHRADDPEGVVGTAFVVAPGWALTCDHVVRDHEAGALLVSDVHGPRPLTGAPISPDDYLENDVALLPVDPTLPVVLPSASERAVGAELMTRGFSTPLPQGSERRFEPRSRVEARYREYRIANAYDLGGDLAEPGFSGAPLLDGECGAVIGVVSSGFAAVKRSWAVALSDAVRWPKLAGVLARNARDLARYGVLCNGAGAQVISDLQLDAGLDFLAQLQKFDRSRDVAREQLGAAVRRFLASDRAVMAIVGASNTGKTWALAQVVDGLKPHPAMLLSAANLPRDSPPSFATFLSQSFAESWRAGGSGFSLPTPELLAGALKAEGRPLLVALDGLNEAMHVWQFQSKWLPEAIIWCRKHGAKLLMTTRPEPWTPIARALPETALFDPIEAMGGVQDRAHVLVEHRVFQLTDFSPSEAQAAQTAYGLADDVVRSIGSHPLLYRIAVDLRLSAAQATVGRVKLVNELVHHQLGDAMARLRLESTLSLEHGVRQIAKAMADSSTDTVTYDAALSLLGGRAVADALISAGVLSVFGDDVRFRFDQVAEFLAPVAQDFDELFVMAREGGTLAMRRIANSALRLEADGREAEFTVIVDAIASTLDELKGYGWWGVVPGIEHIARSLPAVRADVVVRLLEKLCEHATGIVDANAFPVLVKLLESVPLSAATRARLLLKIGPWSTAWPLRAKDWTDEDRRQHFVSALGETERLWQVAPSLHRLNLDHRDAVRPLLIEALADERRLDLSNDSDSRGEATVASMVGGILFVDRDHEPVALLDALIGRSSMDARRLIRVLATVQPDIVASRALAKLHDSLAAGERAIAAEAIDAIRACGQADGWHGRRECIATLTGLIEDPAPGRRRAVRDIGLHAAKALRELDRDSVVAWDRIAEAVVAEEDFYLDLDPIPQARFERALAVSRLKPKAGLHWMREHEGSPDEERLMAQLAGELLASDQAHAYAVGQIVERRLANIEDGGDPRLVPWLDVAKTVVASGPKDSARLLIVYGLFGWKTVFMPRHLATQRAELVELAHTLADADLDRHELEVMMSKLVESPTGDSFERWRREDPDGADAAALEMMRGGAEAALNRKVVVRYFKSLRPAAMTRTARIAVRWGRRHCPPASPTPP